MQNILLITCDQLRHDTLGHVGRFPVRTPNIDTLAAEGTRFTGAYCSNPLCVPSRATIMTGQASYEHGVYYNDMGWPRDTPTIASELSSNGYYSVIVGKTHFMPQGSTGGFDKHTGAHPTRSETRERPHIRPADIPGEIWTHRNGPPEPKLENYSVVEKVDLAIHELELIKQRREAEPGGNEPFFMWLSFQSPHSPCVPPEPYFSMYPQSEVPAPIYNEQEVANFPAPVRRWYDDWQRISPEQKYGFRCQYLGDVTLLDDQIGRVLQRLRQMGYDENTLIVFSSDHGDYLGDHGMLQKGFFHECSSRVPLIFKGPGIARGRTVEAPVTLAELKPTLMEYTKLAYPHTMPREVRESHTGEAEGEAESLIPALTEDGPGLNADRMALSETGIHGQGVMVRYQDQKCAYYPQTDELEWYDLTKDPDELNNLGVSKSLKDAPEPMRVKIEQVLDATRQHADRVYAHNGKVRPMFS